MFEEGFIWGFILWISKPFRSIFGVILLIGVGAYIWLRLTGRVKYKRDQGGGGGSGGGSRPDYVIK